MRDGPVVLAAFTEAGAALAVRLADRLGGRAFAPERCLVPGAERIDPDGGVRGWAGEWFQRAGAMVFVCACGIAVRAIAPWVRAKTQDPAVVVTDEAGRFVIPILSGHIGGANRLARRVADLTGGAAAVTTATDVNGVTAVDEWAVENRCAIQNPRAIKAVSSAVLAGERVGVAVTDELQPAPWPVTLWLRPRTLALGVGCVKGADAREVREAARDFLDGAGVSPLSLRALASIDLKRDEAALLELAAAYGVPFLTFGAERLAAVPGRFSSSERVREVTGVDNVCERASVLAASEASEGGGAVLLRSKARYPRMTFALARARGAKELGGTE